MDGSFDSFSSKCKVGPEMILNAQRDAAAQDKPRDNMEVITELFIGRPGTWMMLRRSLLSCHQRTNVW